MFKVNHTLSHNNIKNSTNGRSQLLYHFFTYLSILSINFFLTMDIVKKNEDLNPKKKKKKPIILFSSKAS